VAVLIVILGVVVLIGVFTLAIALLHGFVLMQLWGWFVVPVFGAPSLSLVEAMGIALVVGYLTNQYIPVPKEKKLEYYTATFGGPLFVLLLGWILHFFM